MSATRPHDAPAEVGPRTPDPLVGTLLDGRYRLEAVLAEGGTGRVYRAVQEALGRRVALKLMHTFAQDPKAARDFAERFLREASLAGGLQHPNVVTVHDFGTLRDGRCFIVMELLEGENLAEVMKRGPLHPLDVIDLFGQIVRGLRQAHRAGLVHRDMKPANVMISPGQDDRLVAKVLDFGLVKSAVMDLRGEGGGVVADVPAELTQVGSFLGTPQYISPEQAKGEAADARADLYAVGVMLYRALTGRLPFDVRGSAAAVAAHLHETVPPMAVRAPGVAVPPALEALTMRCLEKRPDDRWPDADALLDALGAARAALAEAVADEITPVVPPPSEATLVPQVGEREAPARGLLPLAAAIGVLLGVLAVGALFLHFRAPAGPVAGEVASADPTTAPAADVAPTVVFVEAGPAHVESAPEVREVWLLLSSEPAGADVVLDGAELGTTPLARRLALSPGPGIRTFVVRREGYLEERVEIDLSGEQATADVRLRRTGGARSVKAPEAAGGATGGASTGAALGAVVADGVRFTGAEAAASARFVNGATHGELLGAGIAPRQVALILEKRPFADVAVLAETPFIGEKTMESVRAAGRKGP